MIVKMLILLSFFCCLLPKHIYSQPPILLQNPSFEDEPGFSRTPRNWFYCGEIGETPPDIHPLDMFGVTHEAQHGDTYIGMVVRDNGTWEGLSQWLEVPLQAGQCYEFSIYAARSPQYQSLSRKTWLVTNFDRPVILQVWGGNLNCEKAALLSVSKVIESTDWQRYTFQFQPDINYNRIIIEAYYETEATPYCGNVLLDHVSPIVPIHCESKEPAIALETVSLTVQKEDALADLARQIIFSDLDQQLQQHAFYLPSGELYQANKPLFILSQIPKNTPDRKLIFYLNEDNKRFFKVKSENLERELILYGLNLKQFRIQKYHTKKWETKPAVEVLVEIQ